MVSDEHSCSCSHKRDSIANEDPIQFHSLDNGFLSVWSVECSSKVAEEPWVVEAFVAVVAVVVANPFEVLQCQVIVVVVAVELVDGVVVVESVYELERLGEEAMTSFVLHQMKQIRTVILHHHHPYLQHCATLLLPPLKHWQQPLTLRQKGYPNHQHQQQ